MRETTLHPSYVYNRTIDESTLRNYEYIVRNNQEGIRLRILTRIMRETILSRPTFTNRTNNVSKLLPEAFEIARSE